MCDTNTKLIFNALIQIKDKNVIKKASFSCTDGAPAMTGVTKGVTAQLNENAENKAILLFNMFIALSISKLYAPQFKILDRY